MFFLNIDSAFYLGFARAGDKFSQYHYPREICRRVAGKRLPASYGLSAPAVVVLQQILCILLHHILTLLSACLIQPLSPAEQNRPPINLIQNRFVLQQNVKSPVRDCS